MTFRFAAMASVLLDGAIFGLQGCGPKSIVKPPPPIAPTGAAAPITFTDITAQSGVRFVHNNGAYGLKLLPETMGSGAGFIDYDGDGYPDLVLINSRDWTAAEDAAYRTGSGKELASKLPLRPSPKGGTNKLYHNNGDGTFTDVTSGSGIDVPMFGMGVAVGDYDNDGKPDLYITAVGRNYLFHNEGGGKFKDVSEVSGVKDAGWSTSAAFVDYDKDGKLDLFVCHYVDWTPATDIYSSLDGKNKAYTTPDSYVGQVSRLYHNEGGGKFKDVSTAAGTLSQKTKDGIVRVCQGKSLGVTICDFDNDGWPDIVVANDTEPNYLFRNNHDSTFTEVATKAGIAYSESGSARAAMGTDAGDFDGSGRDSLLFGNFSNQSLGLYQNMGGRIFIDVALKAGVGPPSLQFLMFGAAFLDVDNDGWLDICTANGHLDEDIDHVQRDVHYRERPLLFRGTGTGQFTEIGPRAGPGFNTLVVGRGLAYADIDLDGDLDVVITTNGGPPIVLRNDGGNKNNSIRIVLEGTKSNRSGIGAVIEAKVGGATIKRAVRSGSSYCSASELPLTIGLGQAPLADQITIVWPSNKRTEIKDVKANQVVTVNEDKGMIKAVPLPGRSK